MSRKARIGITADYLDNDGKPYTQAIGLGLEPLENRSDLEYQIFLEHLPEVTPEQILGYDMVISRTPKWTRETLTGNEQLLSVHRCGVGYDMVDVAALTACGVMLCITPQAVRRPMATTIITFLLALSTRLMDKVKLAHEGRWYGRTEHCGFGLAGRTLGSIGVGNIGHEMFLLAKPFGMKHMAYDPYINQEDVADIGVQLADMDTVLAESDFVNISCPLSNKTRHMIGEKELKKMKKTAYLINTARGAIIDEAALIKALQKGWIQGAALDVFTQEPPTPDNPLLKMDNVIATPHSMGRQDQYFINMWEELLKQISQVLRGQVPPSLVNREVWDKPQFQSKLKRFLESIR